jgi:hypothetical protein
MKPARDQDLMNRIFGNIESGAPEVTSLKGKPA